MGWQVCLMLIMVKVRILLTVMVWMLVIACMVMMLMLVMSRMLTTVSYFASSQLPRILLGTHSGPSHTRRCLGSFHEDEGWFEFGFFQEENNIMEDKSKSTIAILETIYNVYLMVGYPISVQSSLTTIVIVIPIVLLLLFNH